MYNDYLGFCQGSGFRFQVQKNNTPDRCQGYSRFFALKKQLENGYSTLANLGSFS